MASLSEAPSRQPFGLAERSGSDDHKERRHPQHTDFLGGVAAADPHPHPVPPADFISASSAQQALVPAGAGPPQHAYGPPPCAVDRVADPRFVVCD